MRIFELISGRASCFVFSPILPWPADIDAYVPAEQLSSILDLAVMDGWVIVEQKKHYVHLNKYLGGKLYILDIATSFNVYADYLPLLSVSKFGDRIIAADDKLRRSFKSLCTGRHANVSEDKKLNEFLSDNKLCDYAWLAKIMIFFGRERIKAATSFSYIFRIFRAVQYYFGLLKRKGQIVSIVGPDGSGKSYLIDKLRVLSAVKVVYWGDYFFAGQFLYDYIMRIPSPYNRFVYVFYFLENSVRGCFYVALRICGVIIIADRYPGLNRNVTKSGLLGFVNRLAFRLAPSPNIFVLLRVDPEVVYKRKQELTREEINSHQKAIASLTEGGVRLIIDGADLDRDLNALLRLIYVD